MKAQLSLPEIKLIALDVLKHFSSFCKQNNIQFFLSNGTLLGAIKYGGFIPWDDDIDVFVPREDYDRLIAIYKDSEKYTLFSPERNAAFKFPFAKLCDMTTIKQEINIDNGVQLGIDIDIFPLDSCSKHILRFSVQKRIKVYQTGCILAKFMSSKGKNFYKRILIKYCQILGFEFFYKRLDKIVKKEISLGKDYMGCLMWPIYGRREIIPAEVFLDTVSVNFEGDIFLAPVGYETYLHSLYGDYAKDPPLEKQKSHHRYTAYRV